MAKFLRAKIRVIPCPSGADGHYGRFVFSKDGWMMYRCRTCKHLWTDPMPTEDELVAFYDRGYFEGDTKKHGYVNYDSVKQSTVKDFTYLLEQIEERKSNRGWLLDVGAATGFFMSLAEKRGWRVSGVEISEHAAGVAQSRGLDVATGNVESHLERFHGVDVVTMWDVVEHLRDPFIFFKNLRPMLADNGLIVFATPQSDSAFSQLLGRFWTLLAPPQHIHYFSESSIRNGLRDAGFEVVNIEWRGKDFVFAYVLHFVMG